METMDVSYMFVYMFCPISIIVDYFRRCSAIYKCDLLKDIENLGVNSVIFNFFIQITPYRSLQQQELVNPLLGCCEIVIWWEAFIGERVPNGCHARKKA